ncbi:NAD(P)H-binding protein [Tritonibacter scottomollicae]|uniref:NAD(P)H-binding protein n=1 Tax=Tritonibacter scottomollicae TaxID=483013 RepID=A0ABZ0HLN1_TRISK|nr:NAD(P)H-binding protein [Tritonibacter scottomollicae]WOI34442.1 NAD(P)H-binding protein [Tritonibacter scottomollicae]
MKLFVLGGTGMIGSRIVAEALSRGHELTIGSRSPEVAVLDGVQSVKLDVSDTAALAAQAEAADVTITAVSPRSTGDAIAESNAYAEALIAGLGGNRVVIVGGAGSLNLPDGSPVADVVPEAYRAEAQGMRQAFEKIAASDLDFTVVAPAGLIEPGERTGKFRLGGRELMTDEAGNSRISAEDYAVALMDEVETPTHSREIFHAAY